MLNGLIKIQANLDKGGIKMAKNTGLGKGLDALFGNVNIEEEMQENDVLKNLKITDQE